MDRVGATALRDVGAILEALPWSEGVWLVEHGPVEIPVVVEGVPRTLALRAEWDMDPFASDLLFRTRLSSRVLGRSVALRHRGQASLWAEGLPDVPPVAVPLDRSRF
ncbi:MAG: hypothetical protein AAGC46_18035, partial [Solirubrobacteraceae bacterium]|nr:hypothetical protein [Patulibacter sp.]